MDYQTAYQKYKRKYKKYKRKYKNLRGSGEDSTVSDADGLTEDSVSVITTDSTIGTLYPELLGQYVIQIEYFEAEGRELDMVMDALDTARLQQGVSGQATCFVVGEVGDGVSDYSLVIIVSSPEPTELGIPPPGRRALSNTTRLWSEGSAPESLLRDGDTVPEIPFIYGNDVIQAVDLLTEYLSNITPAAVPVAEEVGSYGK